MIEYGKKMALLQLSADISEHSRKESEAAKRAADMTSVAEEWEAAAAAATKAKEALEKQLELAKSSEGWTTDAWHASERLRSSNRTWARS